ncbi:hypothetical protein L1785_21000 [Antribacter sp. KLBMP9083]|uniref:Uncharacterized protein n=1 Tax=Antribacter soli TaxID=2910976 RepID=A0AA41U8Y0_9MICO|nr:hypothetical protein [Antribacter soli]MCF4119686.1 hypothetical protein [Antribacter soli]MCF4123448.1 hypothetical protein [Antribacter soli]
MTHVAFTGHRGLPDDVVPLVDHALRAALECFDAGGLVGTTSLADGADTLFARAVLDAGGSLTAVIPAADYRDAVRADHRPVLDDLLARAATVITLDHPESTGESHMAAAHRMLDDADELVAVWDGEPARGYGGTADVVAEARRRAMPVTVVWPAGARRD